ncbi:high mobility group protein B1b [Clupea harengus]|uniref:High mobility group protein B1b n=1 Tax=Clupea harengus TaxID=7950 RepID=A0A6P3VX07_CLUHA|nr:high mobility group protein B1b [Clupea harengus]XP_031429110.1 high mobility group protein B1b [Clupea harengus]
MGKDPRKPRGKMSSYAYFVQTCREEHKKKHPEASVNFSEFSKKCSERWKTMSAKEKGKFEDRAKQDKVRYEREMQNYIPPKGEKKKRFKDPNAPKRPPSAFFIFCADFRPKVKGEFPGLTIGDIAKKLGEQWNGSAAEVKQPYEKKAAKLKEKYDKDIAAYRTKGIAGLSKKDDDDEDEDDDEEDDDDDDDDDE